MSSSWKRKESGRNTGDGEDTSQPRPTKESCVGESRSDTDEIPITVKNEKRDSDNDDSDELFEENKLKEVSEDSGLSNFLSTVIEKAEEKRRKKKKKVKKGKQISDGLNFISFIKSSEELQAENSKLMTESDGRNLNTTSEVPAKRLAGGKKRKRHHMQEQDTADDPAHSDGDDGKLKQRQGMKRFMLFVGNISYSTTKQDVWKHFEQAGPVKDVKFSLEKGTNKFKGCGFVEFPDSPTLEKALSLHNTVLNNRRLRVEFICSGDKNKQFKLRKTVKIQALKKQAKIHKLSQAMENVQE